MRDVRAFVTKARSVIGTLLVAGLVISLALAEFKAREVLALLVVAGIFAVLLALSYLYEWFFG